jgi:hypothetical protein
MPRWVIRLFLCLLPAALTPLWFYLISESYLNFGGGEKDIILVIPWLLWSILYAAVFVVCWVKGFTVRRILGYAAGIATATVVVIWFVLLFVSMRWLGVS